MAASKRFHRHFIGVPASRRLLFGLLVARGSAAQVVETAPGSVGTDAGRAARAEVPLVDVVRANLEPSYVGFPLIVDLHTGSLDEIWFETAVAPHFFVGWASLPVAFTVTPKIVLRMYREPSTPVKTPSYMPSFAVFAPVQGRYAGSTTWYGALTLGHHSNGQSGGYYLNDGTVNHESGDFSTNYVVAAANVVGGALPAPWWVSPSLEWHFFRQTSELRGRYGSVRLNAAAELRDLFADDRVSARVTAMLDSFEVKGDTTAMKVARRFPLFLRYTLNFPGVELGAYASAYVGPDYYNVWYDRIVSVFQIGFAGDTSPGLRAPDGDAL